MGESYIIFISKLYSPNICRFTHILYKMVENESYYEGFFTLLTFQKMFLCQLISSFFSLKCMNNFTRLNLPRLIKLVCKSFSLLFTLHYIVKKTIIQFTSQASKLNYNCSLTNTSFTFISIPLPCILRILNIHADCTLQFKCCT